MEPQTIEREAEKAAGEMEIKLPGMNLPPVLRFIALFMLAGGISILGSLFADIANPNTKFAAYILRIIVGLLTITTAYGIIKLQRWALWIYGFALIVGLLVNPLLTLIPLVVLVYLYYKRDMFMPSIFDRTVETIRLKIRERMEQFR